MKLKNNEKGFSGLEIVLALIIVAFVAGVAGYVIKQNKQPVNQSNSSKTNTPESTITDPQEPSFKAEQSEPITANGVTISSPANNATVNSTFNLVGSASGHGGERIDLYIDDYLYILPGDRSKAFSEGSQYFTINKDGTFNLKIDLSGNDVAVNVSGAENEKRPIAAGEHKFHVYIPNYDESVDGPTVSLKVK